MKTIWAIDTNQIVIKPFIEKWMSKNQSIFTAPLQHMSKIVAEHSFPADMKYEFVIPYFVMEEVKNQINLALESYVSKIKLMNVNMLREHWESALRKSIKKEIEDFTKQYKILPRPSSEKIAGWTELFFKKCGWDNISKGDGKDFIIGMEVLDNNFNYLITDNTNDFSEAFKGFTSIERNVAMGDLNALIVPEDVFISINKIMQRDEISIRDDFNIRADSVLLDWKILSYEKDDEDNKTYNIRVSAQYENSYYVSNEEETGFRENCPTKSSAIIILKRKNDETHFEEVELNV